MNSPLLVAHRGGCACAPENSAAALCRALEAGAAAVEIDARPTADGLLVLLHDPTPERVTGETRAARECSARELVAQEVQPGPRPAPAAARRGPGPARRESAARHRTQTGPARLAAEIARRALAALERAGSPQQVVVTSSDSACLEALRQAAPALTTGLVFHGSDPRDPASAAQACGARLVVAQQRRLTPEQVASILGAGLRLWAYTINDAERARELLALGVEGLVTDDEQALGDALGVADTEPARRGGETILALDLGSTSTKAALVDPDQGEIVHRVSVPTPVHYREGGRVEHDPPGRSSPASRDCWNSWPTGPVPARRRSRPPWPPSAPPDCGSTPRARR
ncbi:MAG: glycerophosphodiester phosphodiesterase family protein [Acidobacteriota bacterium]|nr:glycerophosphodiester phosphodiesterase family protein [Acidobacteriota bacterium]